MLSRAKLFFFAAAAQKGEWESTKRWRRTQTFTCPLTNLLMHQRCLVRLDKIAQYFFFNILFVGLARSLSENSCAKQKKIIIRALHSKQNAWLNFHIGCSVCWPKTGEKTDEKQRESRTIEDKTLIICYFMLRRGEIPRSLIPTRAFFIVSSLLCLFSRF